MLYSYTGTISTPARGARDRKRLQLQLKMELKATDLERTIQVLLSSLNSSASYLSLLHGQTLQRAKKK